MDRLELLEKLARIDENIYFSGVLRPDERTSIVIVGASALLLCDLSHKGITKDVDVLQAEDRIRDILFADLDFNSRCSAFSQCLPYNFEDRLMKIPIETLALDIHVPSIEDLAVMKLYRWERPDIEDLTAPEFLAKLDWQLLDELVHSSEEAAASRSSEPANDRELSNLRFNYKEYEKGWKR